MTETEATWLTCVIAWHKLKWYELDVWLHDWNWRDMTYICDSMTETEGTWLTCVIPWMKLKGHDLHAWLHDWNWGDMTYMCDSMTETEVTWLTCVIPWLKLKGHDLHDSMTETEGTWLACVFLWQKLRWNDWDISFHDRNSGSITYMRAARIAKRWETEVWLIRGEEKLDDITAHVQVTECFLQALRLQT